MFLEWFGGVLGVAWGILGVLLGDSMDRHMCNPHSR